VNNYHEGIHIKDRPDYCFRTKIKIEKCEHDRNLFSAVLLYSIYIEGVFKQPFKERQIVLLFQNKNSSS